MADNEMSGTGRKVGSMLRKGIRIGIGKLRGKRGSPKPVGSGGKPTFKYGGKIMSA